MEHIDTVKHITGVNSEVKQKFNTMECDEKECTNAMKKVSEI